MRSSRHQRHREPPRKHPAGSRKKPPPERLPRITISIEEAGEAFWDWAEEIQEMAAQAEEQQYWEWQRQRLRRERHASNLKKKWL